ncbi:MAG: peptidoglycan-associated lipoprotein Pal [Deltaproteobacteria bacterium]|nr:peptidoglycan-associated lipoprotein Pal [Deltaproteobacteria bacterium]
MKKGIFFIAFLFIFAGLAFTGCAKKAVKTDISTEEPTMKPDEDEASRRAAERQAAEDTARKMAEEQRLADEAKRKALEAAMAAKAAMKDIFFDYDRYTIRDDAKPVLETNTKILRENNTKVVIEGHCDERGTSEYNIALGERRALSTKKYLATLGVLEDNMTIISYGEEKPFCMEHAEECWQKNRRAHFNLAD